ncbi:unnamed protein product [Adineta steineri]|uniref:Transmembrane protein n=1 Tax=Adineta steineri TaxID=433720 RepID=A0A816EJS7_9BILA|nr:unnamed protein product [Adineta steineri]CAF1646937.1 unnamed protein product [Adineta steineri]
MNESKKKKAIVIRWFAARLICLTHLIISIFLLVSTKFAHYLFFIPIIGIGLVLLEILIFSLLKFRFQYSFFLLLTYSIFIISSIWILELYKINNLTAHKDHQTNVEISSITSYESDPSEDNFYLSNKSLWSEIQTQAYIFIIVILKGLCETKDHRLDIVIRTWTTALDILDFIDLLNHPKLYSDYRFVYITLTIWSISCFQFIIQISTIKKFLINKNYHRLATIITYSLLSMIITDIPYLIIRLYAIFGVRKHDYTSYFLVFKNIVVITLQTADVWMAFNKTTKKIISTSV